MEKRIISLVPAYRRGVRARLKREQLTIAAWNFAHSLLWDKQPFGDTETEYAKRQITAYFRVTDEKKKAFIAFCERVILAQKYHSANPAQATPSPAVWFNPLNSQGFPATKNWCQQVQEKRAAEPAYLRHIAVMSLYYYRYTVCPSAEIFNRCTKKLQKLKAPLMLQQFYNTIVHYDHLAA
jgi:hypothetical protein